MGWFDDQIRQRMESDQNILEDSFFRLAGVVMDSWADDSPDGSQTHVKAALGDILRYYRLKQKEIPENIVDAEGQLKYVLHSSGLMVRKVELEEGWQHHAFGPMMAYFKETGTAAALLPGVFSGYWYRDPSTGKMTRVTRKTAQKFSREALCFYQPLPMKKLGIPDLMHYIKKSVSRGDLILLVLMSFMAALVGLLEPKIYHMITSSILQSKNIYLLAGTGSFLLCSAFAAQMIIMMRTLVMERIGTKASQAVEASVMMRILNLPVRFFRDYSSGELSSRAESVSILCDMVLNDILSVGLTSLMSLLYVTQIFRYTPALVLPSLLITITTVVISVIASLIQMRISKRKMELDAKERGMSFALMNGIQKIRLSGAEKRSFARWGQLYAQKARLEYNPPVFLKVNTVITTAVTLLGTVLLYHLAVKSGVNASEYYAFSAAYGRLSAAFAALTGIAATVAGIKPVLEMAEPILQTEPEVTEEKRAADRISGSISLSHVSFRYQEDTPYILHDLSFEIKAGEYVAVVGRTGCGKSTLVRLLLGFEKPEMGLIYYDRYDLNWIDLRTLRKHIGVVIQNGQLFQGDIFSNIMISAPQITLDDAWEAAEIAGVAQDIRDMPMGMHTMISEGTGGISGGQKQRILIARAIASRPKILIFDEATSALDNKTQKQVSDALDRMGCTRVVIAHRLSTIRHCDRILVLEGGKIVESGKYEELIEKGGFFAELIERQRLDNDTDQ